MNELDLFTEALNRTDPAERAAFLDQSCAGNPELRRRLEELLAGYARGGSPLDRPPVAPEGFPATANLPATIPSGEHQLDGSTEAFAHTDLDSTTAAEPVASSPPANAPGGRRTHEATEALTGADQDATSASASVAAAPRAARVPTGEGIGTVIAGRYTLLEVLGEGGMGTVYLAEQTAPVRRMVALKLIKIGMDSRAVLARFDAERQALALMDHPNIARVYDGGTTVAGQPFFVMELVDGEPITDYCDRLRQPVQTRLELFVSVCQAVQHAHQKGIIHRDLKPHNVMVTEVDDRATPKVIDFGVAKATEFSLTDLSLADTGAIVGTPTYMSPEQADPSSMDIDTRTDVYALGVILYELLAGSPPLDARQFKRGAILEMLRMVREVDPPKPSTKVSTAEALPNIAASRDVEPAHLKRALQGDLDWIVMRAIEKDRTRRYETANGFAADVLRHLAHEPVVAAPPSRAYRLRKFLRRHRGAVIAASLVILALLGGLVAVAAVQTVANTRLSASLARETSANTALALANDNLVDSRAAVQEQLTRAEWLLYAGKLMLAQNDFEAGDGGLALHFLEQCQANLRGWEHRYLWTRINAKQTLWGHRDVVRGVAFSPDGQRIVTGSYDGTARVWDAETCRELIALHGHAYWVLGVAFSPDGERIVTGGGEWGSGKKTGEVMVWDARSGRRLLDLKGHSLCVWSVAFSPDGKRIVTGAGDWSYAPGEAKVWDARTGQWLLDLKGHTHGVRCVAFSPDGKRIATGSANGTVKVWDASTGQVVLDLKGHADGVYSVAFNREGKRILTGSMDNNAKVWDAEKGQEVLTINGHSGFVWGVGFSPDGKRIVTGNNDNTVRVCDAGTGREVLALKGHARRVFSVAYSPDGKRILSGGEDATARVWDAEKGQELPTLNTAGINGLAYSPDGKRIVTVGGDKTAKLWDAATSQQLLELKGHTDWVWSVAFSRDGKRVVTGSKDQTARVWDAATGQELLALKGHTAEVYGVAFSPDGQRILTGAGRWPNPDPGEAKVWDAENGHEVLALKGQTFGVSSVVFSPDGKRIVTGGVEGTAKVWDAATGQELLALKGHKFRVESVAFSPDGQRIVTASDDNTVRVWDVEKGHEQLVLKGHTDRARSAAFSPDGQRIVTGGDDRAVKLWDAEKGYEVLSLKHNGRVWGVEFSPDGRHIAAGGPDGKVTLWDAKKGQKVLVLKGHTDVVTSVAFSPDGARIFAWNARKKVLAWSAADGESIAPVDPPPAPPPGPARSPDGFRHAMPQGKTIAVTDNRPPPQDNAWPLPDAAQRLRYHTAQAALAVQEKQWFAAEFHLRRVLRDDPENAAVKTQPQDLAAIVQELQHWKKDSDLSGIRDATSLSNLPEAERKGFQALWAEVEALLERAQKPKP